MAPRLANTKGYGPLAAYVRTTLRTAVKDVTNQEDWGFLDEAAPPELQEIDRCLEDIAAITAECTFGDTPSKLLIKEARSGPRTEALSRAAALARRNARLRHEHAWRQRVTDLTNRGLHVKLHQRLLGSQADGWPAIATALELQVASVFEWTKRADSLVGLLQEAGDSYFPPVILFPTINGRRVDLVAISLFQTGSPHPDLAQDDEWNKVLPPSVRTPLTDLITEAHHALQLISGLAVMGTYRSLDTFEEILRNAENTFTEAWNKLLSEPDDELTRGFIEVLQNHAGRAIYELTCAEEGDPVTGSLAETMCSAAGIEPSDTAIEIIGIRTFALQADLDRNTALQQLK